MSTYLLGVYLLISAAMGVVGLVMGWRGEETPWMKPLSAAYIGAWFALLWLPMFVVATVADEWTFIERL